VPHLQLGQRSSLQSAAGGERRMIAFLLIALLVVLLSVAICAARDVRRAA
jgi:hypothetical protein